MASPPSDMRFALKPIPFHHDEGEERGERQNERDDDRAAHVGQQDDQNDENENRAFLQRLGDRVNRLLHQIGAVVKRHQFDAFRQRLLNRGQLFLHRVDHIAPARAFEHQHDSGDRFAFAIRRHRALAQFGADLHVRHIAHINRRVLLRRDDDVFDVTRVFHQAQAAHDVLLGLMLDEIAARVGVVFFQRLENLLQA